MSAAQAKVSLSDEAVACASHALLSCARLAAGDSEHSSDSDEPLAPHQDKRHEGGKAGTVESPALALDLALFTCVNRQCNSCK